MADEENWLGLEPLLLAHLAAKLDAKVKVLPARDLAGVLENQQIVPAVQIYFGGYRTVESQANGAIQRIEQTWYAVTTVRNAAAQNNGKASRDDAGLISSQVLRYLLGWLPAKNFSRLNLANAPKPAFSKGGYGYIPLGFTTQMSVRGESQRPTGA